MSINDSMCLQIRRKKYEEKVVSNSLFDNAIWSFDIYFENTPDANDLAKKLTDIFGMEPDDIEKDKSYLTWDLEGYWLALSNRKNKPCYISIQ